MCEDGKLALASAAMFKIEPWHQRNAEKRSGESQKKDIADTVQLLHTKKRFYQKEWLQLTEKH